MSESDEPINSDSASEDEKNGTEESETSDDQYLSDFTRLQPYVYEPSVSKESVKKKLPGKETLVELVILSGVFVANANQWLLIQKAFADSGNMKFVKVISKLFHLFWKYFYPVSY